jgi:hypothetical protein
VEVLDDVRDEHARLVPLGICETRVGVAEPVDAADLVAVREPEDDRARRRC